MRLLHHGLLLRTRLRPRISPEEAHQPNRDGQKAEDEPNWEYAGFKFGVDNNPPAEADYPDRDQIGIHSAPFRVNCARSGTVDR